MSNRYLHDADALWPLIEPKVRKIVTAGALAGGASSGGGGVSEHDLGGSLHKGPLRDDQGPQFLLVDGSRALTGNLLVSAGVTIDGVDLSVHAADPDAHHARQHDVFATADHTATGNAWQIGGFTATNTWGKLTPLSDVTGGVKEALLKSNSSGYVTVVRAVASERLRAPLIDTATGHLTLGPAVDLLLSPGSNLVKLLDGKAIQTESFVSGFAGNGFRIDQGISRTGKTHVEVDDLTVRGRMSVYELLIRQIRATNGSIFVSSSAKVKRVNTISGGWQLHTTTVSETPTATSDAAHGFLVGDLVRSQRTRWNGAALEGIYQCDLRVTGVPSLYTFDAVHIAGDLPVAGMDFVRIGSATDPDRRGSVYLTADDTNAPFIDVVDGIASHADWNTAGKVKVRLGKLTGISGQVDAYGIFSGNPAATWQSMETVNGFRIGVAGAVRFGVDTSGNLRLYNSAGTNVISLDNDGSSYFAGVMTIGVNGEIQQGTGVLGSTYTGLRIWRDGDVGRIGGYKSNVLQWYGDTLGELRAGTGLLALADDGLGLARYQTSFGVPIAGTESRAAVAWWDNIDSRTGAPLARIYASRSDAGSGAYPTLSIEVDPANANANLRPSLWLIGNRAGFAPTLWLGNIYNVVGLPGIYPSRDATTLADTVQFSGSLYFEAHLLRDPANADLDVGTAGNPFRTIYASQVIATTISGASMAGQTWTYPGSMVIDAKAAGAQTVSIVNTFAGGTADLSVEGNITLGGTVDTVDVAALKTAYDSHIVAYAGHIGNVNAHHAQQHGLDGADHTGTLSWSKVSKTGSDLADLATRAHGSLTGIGPDDHHDQVHGIISANHTVTGSFLQLVGLTGANALGLITPSSDPGAASAILRTNSLGYLTLQMLALRGNVLRSLGVLALRNGDDSAYQSLALSSLYSIDNIYYSNQPAQFVTDAGLAQGARVGSLLVSSSYASTYTANVPAQGIYSVGAVRGDSSATFAGNVTGAGIIGGYVNNTNGYWYTPAEWHTFRDITTGNFKPVAMSKLLVSNDSGHFGRVPDNGIYSLGAIRGDVKLSTPLIDTITGNLTIQPAGDLVLDPVGGEVFVASAATLRASTWTPGVLGTGWGIQDRAGQAGKAHLDIRSIYTDELIATTFTADQVRVRSGSDWLGEALAIAARDNSDLKVTIPAVGSSVRIFVENAPEVAGRIFDENEYVLIKTINRSSGLVIRETWGQVSGYIAESGARQSYLWTTRSGGSGFVLEPGTALTGFGVSGGSYIFRTVVETGRGPYERFATWSGNPYTSANRISRVEVGDLRGVIGDATTRYGIAGGNNLALTPATGFSGFSSDSVYGFRLFNSELELYSGTARKIWMSKDAGLYFRSQVGGFDGRSLRWTYDLSTNTPEDAAVVFVSGDGITSTLNINAYRAGYSVSDLILRSVSGTTTLDAYVRLSANATSSVFQVISQDGAVFRAGSGGGFEFYRDGGTTPPFTVGSYQVWHAGNFSPSAYAPLSGAAFTGAISVTGTFTASSSIVGSSLTSTTGYVASDNTIRLTNATGSAYQNIIAAGISASYINNDNGYWYTPAEWHTFRDITTGNFKPVAMSKLLVSNDSGHFGRAPANGIYSLGGIAIATSDGLTSGYSLDVAGAARFRGSIAANAHFNLSPIAEPATSASTGILWMGTDNKLYFKKPSGTAIVVAG